jgi:N-acetylglucosamine-6-phosphate deacetylase
MATHLFNAMSGLNHREPGLVGATLSGAQSYGIIADGHHVADAALRIALAAHLEGAIPVSDAMAVAGTDMPELRPSAAAPSIAATAGSRSTTARSRARTSASWARCATSRGSPISRWTASCPWASTAPTTCSPGSPTA